MFSYYGSKSKLVKLYPKPRHATIIEPFAGSARYALEHWERNVKLYDVSPTVIGVWHYLQQASVSDILSLPEPPSKVNINDFAPSLTEPEKDLIGFHLCRGKAVPRKTGHGQNGWARDKKRIADNLHKIRHWSVELLSFEKIFNQLATWFIDPPYQSVQTRKGNGDRYPCWSINYACLAEWCKARSGQIIVCEGEGADWLPFQLLAEIHTNTNAKTVKKNGEYVYLGG